MKKYLFLIISLLTVPIFDASACNVCGCGVSNYHYGILPQFRKNFVGIRYRYRSYDSRLDDGHAAPFSYETFQSTELWARFYPLKKVQAFVFVPYNFNERREGDKTTYLNGLGDVVISANYNLINTYDSLSTGLQHNLLLGGGVKLPTGAFQEVENGLTVNQNFQLGTGSVDVLFNLIYTMRYKRAGLNTEFTYNINTTNKDEYRFGNTSRIGLTGFYVMAAGAFTLMPNAGVGGEWFDDNRQYGEPFPDTGGWAMVYNAGLETYYRSMALGVMYSHPGKQELFSGKVQANGRVAVHVTVMF